MQYHNKRIQKLMEAHKAIRTCIECDIAREPFPPPPPPQCSTEGYGILLHVV